LLLATAMERDWRAVHARQSDYSPRESATAITAALPRRVTSATMVSMALRASAKSRFCSVVTRCPLRKPLFSHTFGRSLRSELFGAQSRFGMHDQFLAVVFRQVLRMFCACARSIGPTKRNSRTVSTSQSRWCARGARRGVDFAADGMPRASLRQQPRRGSQRRLDR